MSEQETQFKTKEAILDDDGSCPRCGAVLDAGETEQDMEYMDYLSDCHECNTHVIVHNKVQYLTTTWEWQE